TDRRLKKYGGIRTDVARSVWTENLPNTERGLALEDLAFFTYRLADDVSEAVLSELPETVSLGSLIDSGVVEAEPIVYEDFLPRSAAGIFQSNLTGEGSRDDALQGTDYDITVMSRIVGRPVADPHDLYRAQQEDSLREISTKLNRTIEPITAD